MHAYRPGDPLNDADLDRELSAAMAVDPSPEFLARVRIRIAAEPEPSIWQRPWLLAAAGVCALVIVASVALAQMGQPEGSIPGLVAGLAAVVPPITPAPLAVAGAVSRRSRDTRSAKPSAELRAVMNANAEASAALRMHLKERDYAALASDAATYRQNFTFLEGFWANREVAEAARISRTGLLAAAALEAAAHARDDAALETAIAAILGTCGVCHRHYREELPDGTYEIRL